MSTEQVKFNINQQNLTGKKIAVVKANFNSEITDQMLAEAKKVLEEHKVEFDVYEVPGSFEVPYQIKKITDNADNYYDGFVAVGCLIKGETLHFEYIAESVSHGLTSLSLELVKPIGFAILTCLNEEQARARIDLGAQATQTVLELISK